MLSFPWLRFDSELDSSKLSYTSNTNKGCNSDMTFALNAQKPFDHALHQCRPLFSVNVKELSPETLNMLAVRLSVFQVSFDFLDGLIEFCLSL